MTFWDSLFDNDHRQRRDINSLRANLSSASMSADAALHGLDAAIRRIERVELVCEALVELMKLKSMFKIEELSLMVQRVDLADGFEDGRIGPDRSADAPVCPGCGRPVNPRRTNCLFCHAELPDASEAPPSPEPRFVNCSSCQTSIDESQSYFSGAGLVCETCFHSA